MGSCSKAPSRYSSTRLCPHDEWQRTSHLGSIPGECPWDFLHTDCCGFPVLCTRASRVESLSEKGESARPVRSRTCWLGNKETLRDDDLIFRVPGPVDHAFTTLHGEVDVSHHGHRWKPLDAGHCTIQHNIEHTINTDECLQFESGWFAFLPFYPISRL